MSKKTDAYFRDVPMKPYDLIREGLVVLAVVVMAVLILAIAFGSPDYPTVRAQDVANSAPLALVRTGTNILAGKSSLQDYGPPYTPDSENAQSFLGIAPANWTGVTDRIDAQADLLLKPLEQAAFLNQDLQQALQEYQSATGAQRQDWLSAYSSALDNATVNNGEVQVPSGQYGPVPTLMQGLLDLGKAGLIEGALGSSTNLPYQLGSTRAQLFFQDGVDHQVAKQLDMLGEQWGMSHETGSYPGGWWLWPVVLLYQLPSLASSPNADLLIGLIVGLAFLVLFFLPMIPFLRDVPKFIGAYKVIWRDWYAGRAQKGLKKTQDKAWHPSGSGD
ncbi:MAG: hypothetical protein PVI04_10035 [Anaerolineales bacterium]|jgi:hypothetical protein